MEFELILHDMNMNAHTGRWTRKRQGFDILSTQ